MDEIVEHEERKRVEKGKRKQNTCVCMCNYNFFVYHLLFFEMVIFFLFDSSSWSIFFFSHFCCLCTMIRILIESASSRPPLFKLKKKVVYECECVRSSEILVISIQKYKLNLLDLRSTRGLCVSSVMFRFNHLDRNVCLFVCTHILEKQSCQYARTWIRLNKYSFIKWMC